MQFDLMDVTRHCSTPDCSTEAQLVYFVWEWPHPLEWRQPIAASRSACPAYHSPWSRVLQLLDLYTGSAENTKTTTPLHLLNNAEA